MHLLSIEFSVAQDGAVTRKTIDAVITDRQYRAMRSAQEPAVALMREAPVVHAEYTVLVDDVSVGAAVAVVARPWDPGASPLDITARVAASEVIAELADRPVLHSAARQLGEWSGDEVQGVRLAITLDFVERIFDILAGVRRYQLDRATADYWPAFEWQGDEDIPRTEGDECVVTSRGEFWFAAREKHSDTPIESEMVSVWDVVDAYRKQEDLYVADDVDLFRRLVACGYDRDAAEEAEEAL